MSEQDTIDALARAVGASDAGRRVGWARAYSAESSKDQLSRELNIMRLERDIMRRAASFLFGFMRTYLQRRGDGAVAEQALTRWAANVDRILDTDVVKAGKDAAEHILPLDEQAADALASRQAAKRARRNAAGRDFKTARGQERKLLMKRYGFDNEAALLNYLEQYQP